MSLHRYSWLAVAVVLTACAGNLAVPSSGQPLKAGPTAKPRSTPDPLSSKAPAALAVLKAPAGATSKFTGAVAIDAYYAIQTAGASLIGADGAKLGGADRASLIGPDGASLVGPDGATLVGPDGASLIGMDGASVYVGAGLFGADGASLIGADGGTLVAAGAGNLIGQRAFALRQAAEARKFNLGTVLRAAAMELQAHSMADGTRLSLGEDATGRAVYSVYTNARGEYTVYLPADIAGHNVILTAGVPGSADRRLIYGAVADARGANALHIDEDSSLASAYFREAFISRIEREFLFEVQGRGAPNRLLDQIPGAAPVIADLKVGVAASGVAQLPPLERRIRSTAVGDAILGYQPMAEFLDPDTDRPVLDELASLFVEVREKVGVRMREDPTYFDKQAFLQAANAELGADEKPYRIARPSDFPHFVLQHYLVRATTTLSTLARLEAALGAVYGDEAVAKAKVARLDALMQGMLLKSMLLLVTNEAAKEQAIAAMYAKP